ncbi:MAG: hypothetical protein V2I97_03535, partial [Desulfococcaceae bacterium]|nr:hypothetical protein [Desulfococcaceae bacterium]
PDLQWQAPHCRSGRKKKDKIRIGFISAFLFPHHTIGKLNLGLIRNLSREKFSVRVFQFRGKDGKISRDEHIPADEYVLLPSAYPAARQAIAEQKLDILFYLDIGMDPLTYFLAYARLAPVQCVTWGHPVTTGIPNMDYFISAEMLEPEDAQIHYTEKLICFKKISTYYYRPKMPERPSGRENLKLPEDKNLYTCPQTLFKFHPDYDHVLKEILRKDPKSVLVLLEGKYPEWKDALKTRFLKNFPNAENRLIFLKFLPLADYLSLLMVSDAVMDPLYFGGGNSSYEAFSCGVPVVTWPGPYMRGRVTSAAYHQMEMKDCIADDFQSYVHKTLQLVHDREWKNFLQEKIHHQSCVLFEDKEVVTEFETFFETVINR